jgi:hypothetical protein
MNKIFCKTYGNSELCFALRKIALNNGHRATASDGEILRSFNCYAILRIGSNSKGLSFATAGWNPRGDKFVTLFEFVSELKK